MEMVVKNLNKKYFLINWRIIEEETTEPFIEKHIEIYGNNHKLFFEYI